MFWQTNNISRSNVIRRKLLLLLYKQFCFGQRFEHCMNRPVHIAKMKAKTGFRKNQYDIPMQ